MGNIAHQLVNVLETLGGTVDTNITMPTGQQGVEKVGIKVFFEAPAIHLHGQFIHSNDSNRQGIKSIINRTIDVRGIDDLGKAIQMHIRNIQINIR